MKLNRIPNLLLMPCLLGLMTGAMAARAQSASSTQASPADKHFVTAALRGGMAEVELGRMAAEKGNSDDVKQFGQKMVEDHTKLGDQMKGVAEQIGVTPPTVLTASDLALEAKLKALSGDEFDKAYIRAMVKAHETDLAAFRKEAAAGTSPAVTGAAGEGAKMVHEHLEMIRKIAQTHQVAVRSQAAGSNSGAL
jgi:putative membrane protein